MVLLYPFVGFGSLDILAYWTVKYAYGLLFFFRFFHVMKPLLKNMYCNYNQYPNKIKTLQYAGRQIFKEFNLAMFSKQAMN